jgi:hypothetical protein
MSRIHYVPVPESDTEIIEEVTYCRRTTWGVKIKQDRTPMEQPIPKPTGHISRSQGKSKKQAQLCYVEETLQESDDPGESSKSRCKSQRHAKL